MSTANGWDLTVPEDESELLAELRRHGVRAGQRLHIVETSDEAAAGLSDETEVKHRILGWVAMGETDKNISENVNDHLSGFGR